MNMEYFAFGIGIGALAGFISGWGYGQRGYRDAIWERDQERARADAYLERMRRDDVRRSDRPTVEEIEDEAGM